MLFIAATAVVLSIISLACFPENGTWKHLSANGTAKSSRQLIGLLTSVTDHLPPVEIPFITTPHPAREEWEYSVTSTLGWRMGLKLPSKLHNHHCISETPFSEIAMCASKFPLEHLRALILSISKYLCSSVPYLTAGRLTLSGQLVAQCCES